MPPHGDHHQHHYDVLHESYKELESSWHYLVKHFKSSLYISNITYRKNRDTLLATVYVVLNSTLFLLEIICSLYSGSLGFLIDAFFRAYQCLCILISLSASILSKRPINDIYTYGYDRTEILASFASTVGLIFLCLYMMVESFHHLFTHTEVQIVEGSHHTSGYIMVIAVIMNFVGYLLFGRYYHKFLVRYTNTSSSSPSSHDSNMESIALHMLADGLSTLGLIVTHYLLYRFSWADSLVSIIVCIVLFQSAISLCSSTGKILLMTTPLSIENRINKSLREIVTLEGVLECSESHFWTQSPNIYVGTILVRAHRNANESELLVKIYSIFNSFITHLTVQIEKDPDIDWFLNSTTTPEFVPIKTTPTKKDLLNRENEAKESDEKTELSAVIEEQSDMSEE